ncbi:MAG: hypothetical protein EHM59_12820 [Betaproteobacteria bacterium]|nr:MAG: hypothetical protein EHM59_12820 [Betaproteobacteria bacterium]
MSSALAAASRWVLLPLLVACLWVPASSGASAAAQTNVYLFWGLGCPHCERAIDFLKRLEAEDVRLRVRYFEVTREKGNVDLFRAVIKAFEIEQPGVPLTVVGDQIWVGYSVDEQTGAQIRDRLEQCYKAACPDSVAGLIARLSSAVVEARPPDQGASSGTAPSAGAVAEAPDSSSSGTDGASANRLQPGQTGRLPEQLHLPLIGEIRLHDFSLPALTLLLGAIDGFNPCAMWTLVFLIGLLLGMKDTLRMWVLGAAFIVGSAAVYFVFMAAWLNILLFLGSLVLIRVSIGLVALGGGGYYLREFVLNKGEVCEVTAPERRQRVFGRLRSLAQERSFVMAFLGIVALAFLVNLVELICSAGIPVVYTQILTMSGVPSWQYYGYMLLYIVAFMADDLIVFFTAMTTLRVAGLTTRYSRYSHLLGGLVLVTIGALMLLRPEWLLYG